MILNYISLPVFFISFGIGLLFIYIMGPDEKIIYVYPTPKNYKSIQYRDGAGECFQFRPIPTNCPINSLSIKTIPIQT